MTARTATVQNILLQPGTSAPMVGATVTFELNTPGFTNGTFETVGTAYATTDASGLWSKTLVINDDIDPAGTSWYVTEPIAGRRSIQLVAAHSGLTVNFRAVLVANPSNPNPLTAGVPLPAGTVPSGYVWTTDGAGSGAYLPETGGGGGGGAVASVNGQAGVVVLAASDVGADASGAAAAAQVAAVAASQPLDSDLTAIAALTTTSYGRAFLALADAAAGRTALGLGTAATSASTDFQPIDSDLTAIAALTTTSFGQSFLALADAAAGRTLLGLGTLATQSGTFSGTSSGTNTGDQTLPTTLPPNGAAGGDLAGTYPNPTLAVDRIPKSTVTTKGDLLVATGSGVVARHGVGTDGQALVADSTETDGVKWGVGGGVHEGRAKWGAGPTIALSMPGVSTTGNATTLTMSPNRAAYTPFRILAAVTIDQLVIEVTTAQAASHMRLAIYAATIDWQPTGAPVVDSGAIDTSSTGVKTTTVTLTTLPLGNYLFWTNADTAGIVVRAVSCLPLVGYHPTLGGNTIISQMFAAQTYGAPPSTPLAWDTASAAVMSVWVFVRESTP